jgi:hypothetical protein
LLRERGRRQPQGTEDDRSEYLVHHLHLEAESALGRFHPKCDLDEWLENMDERYPGARV